MHKVQQFKELPLKESHVVVLEHTFKSINSQLKFNSLYMIQIDACVLEFAHQFIWLAEVMRSRQAPAQLWYSGHFCDETFSKRVTSLIRKFGVLAWYYLIDCLGSARLSDDDQTKEAIWGRVWFPHIEGSLAVCPLRSGRPGSTR